MELPTHAVIAALDARLVRAQRLPGSVVAVTDTRRLRAGETFVALRGARFDGHAFVEAAVAAGAAAAIVDDPSMVPDEAAALVVADTGVAYLALGRLARERLSGPVIAVTGSTGKTTTKELIVQSLRAAGHDVVATPENENNEIGVPKLLLGCADGDRRLVVVEMGARTFLDLHPLVEAARPHVAVLTNVGDAHLEIFGTRERLAETKWGIFSSGAHAVLSLADEVTRRRAATLLGARTWFGLDAERPTIGERGVVLTAGHVLLVGEGPERRIEFEHELPGEHNRRNLAAALAAVWAAGVDPAVVAASRPAFRLPAGRYERIRLAGGPTLVYDAYNASRSGALATLAAFAGETGGRRIVVLGSMAELGDEAAAMHEEVGAAAARAADVVLVGGEFAEALASGAQRAGLAGEALVRYGDNEAAAGWLRAHTGPGDLVLLKGSRMYRMEQIVAELAR